MSLKSSNEVCLDCGGKGKKGLAGNICRTCGGLGRSVRMVECPNCYGMGKWLSSPCWFCKGTGMVDHYSFAIAICAPFRADAKGDIRTEASSDK
jgi:DnaJ-class molecular chaperone